MGAKRNSDYGEGTEKNLLKLYYGGFELEVRIKVSVVYFFGITSHYLILLTRPIFLLEKYGETLRDAIKDGTLPLDRIIVQTNAPYMTPNGPRNELDPVSQTLLDHCCIENEPCTLSIIVRTIAKCISQEPRQVADACTETAMKVFRFQKFEPNCE